MKYAILQAISDVRPHSPNELDTAYNFLGSFDRVVAAVNLADRQAIPLQEAVNLIDEY